MSHRAWEDSAPDPETPIPVTPTKPPCNAGAGHDSQDAENSECEDFSDDPHRKKKRTRKETKKRERHLIVYVAIKRWPLGELAEMEEDLIWIEVAEEARKEMLLSGYRKAIHPKPSDLGMWKKGQEHESRGFHYTIFKCPMNKRAGCKCVLRLVMCKDYVELQRSELRHNASSHAQDDSKTLKYEQMIAIREAAITAQQLSAAMLRRNMTMHDSLTKTIAPEHLRSFRHQVYRTRKALGAKQLKGFELNDSFGKMEEFADTNLWSELVRRHNDPVDSYHIDLHDFCVIGHQNEAAMDVLRLNLSSLWMLSHAFRVIKTCWGFQLNADVTGKVCNKSVDLVAFSVTSMPKRNNTMCLCIIPATTESEPCATIVETAMCDNFKGWGNFAETVLGIKSNICHTHAPGNVQFLCNL